MGRRNSARANIVAIPQRVTTKRAIFTRDHFQSFVAPTITRIDNQTERSIERHRADIARIQRDQSAGRITRAAINALRLVVQSLSFLARVWNWEKIILIQICARHKSRQRAIVSVEKRVQIDGEIANHRQIAQRLDFLSGPDIFNECAASKLLAAVHHHCAGTAHANATGKSKGQIAGGSALQSKKRIENAGAFAHFDFVRFKARLRIGLGRKALDDDRDFQHGQIVLRGKSCCKLLERGDQTGFSKGEKDGDPDWPV